MKKTITFILCITTLAGCSLASKKMVHPEHGAVSATDELYLADHDQCLAEFLRKDENIAKVTRQENASQVASVLAMDDLAGLIHLTCGLAMSDEALTYVNSCLKTAGWQESDG